ncbi:DivIVA domain-containing protein [Actinophytocola sp.]|uniref:DivIVA domain-containing protein n=1 Tax=Actinophytocola sp. TaxID=1872138 RepID=UPI002ED301C1
MSRPGKLTSDDVQSVVFDQSSRLSRGYNEQQVDAFLDLVADTIEDLTAKLAEKRADTDRVMGEAQRNAEAIVRRAQAVAEQIENEARARAARIVAEASQRAGAMPMMAQGEDFAAAAVAVGTRIGGIRDALSAELANLYRLIGRVQNTQNGNNRPR